MSVTEYTMTIWTIYAPGTDGFAGYTARMWLITPSGAMPTEQLMRTLDVARLRDIFTQRGLSVWARHPTDESGIVESWF